MALPSMAGSCHLPPWDLNEDGVLPLQLTLVVDIVHGCFTVVSSFTISNLEKTKAF